MTLEDRPRQNEQLDNEHAVQVARAFLESANEQTLKSWVLRGFKDGAFDPVDVQPRSEFHGVRDQVKAYFDRVDGSTQERLKRAVALALLEWRLHGHGLAMLHELVYLAADLRASEAVPIMCALITSGKIGDIRSRDAEAALVGIVAVLGGFAGEPQAARFLRSLYFDPTMPDRISGIILNALCEFAPARYVEYIPQFMRVVQRGAARINAELVFRQFVRAVRWDFIAEGLDRLEPPVRASFLFHVEPLFRNHRWRMDPVVADVIGRHLKTTLRDETNDLTGVTQSGDFHSNPIPSSQTKRLMRNVQYLKDADDIIHLLQEPVSEPSSRPVRVRA